MSKNKNKKPTTTTAIPAGAKKPTDHQAKQDDGPIEVTIRGEKFNIPREALDDFELLDDMVRVQDGDRSRISAVLRRFVGVDQFRAVMDLARDEDTGRVSHQAGIDIAEEIMEALKVASVPNS